MFSAACFYDSVWVHSSLFMSQSFLNLSVFDDRRIRCAGRCFRFVIHPSKAQCLITRRLGETSVDGTMSKAAQPSDVLSVRGPYLLIFLICHLFLFIVLIIFWFTIWRRVLISVSCTWLNFKLLHGRFNQWQSPFSRNQIFIPLWRMLGASLSNFNVNYNAGSFQTKVLVVHCLPVPSIYTLLKSCCLRDNFQNIVEINNVRQ